MQAQELHQGPVQARLVRAQADPAADGQRELVLDQLRLARSRSRRREKRDRDQD